MVLLIYLIQYLTWWILIQCSFLPLTVYHPQHHQYLLNDLSLMLKVRVLVRLGLECAPVRPAHCLAAAWSQWLPHSPACGPCIN